MAELYMPCIYHLVLTLLIFCVGINTIFASEQKISSKTAAIPSNSSSQIVAAKNATTDIDTAHKGREHVFTQPTLKGKVQHNLLNTTTTPLKSNKTFSVTTVPTIKSKNVSNISISITPKTTTVKVTTPKPTKPKITEHDEVPVAKADTDLPKFHIDSSMDKKVRRADYIVPIVAVILSVPLVAIIISVLFKRGKDWWTHRNYRRMDYLIEGIYNS